MSYLRILLISSLIITSCTHSATEESMPLSTESDLARELYDAGMIAYNEIKIGTAVKSLEMALVEDPNFFMAQFWMYFMSSKNSKAIAQQVLQNPGELNRAEQEIKTAFKYLLDGQDKQVVEHLNEAISLHPKDPELYKILYIIQLHFQKDIDGAIGTLRKAIEVQPEFASAYNQLGYALMYRDDFPEAEVAFDMYIKLKPEEANPYDSKGDYYMNLKRFDQAYESYLKAYSLDSSFKVSKKKAEKARVLMEQDILP